MSKFHIRLMHSGDLKDVMDIFSQAFMAPAQTLSFLFQIDSKNWFVACDKDRVVAMVAFFDFQSCVYVGCMGVLPEYQRRGLGKILMTHILQMNKGKKVYLDASEAGLPLYKALGFELHDKALMFVLDHIHNFEFDSFEFDIRPVLQSSHQMIYDFDKKTLLRNRECLLSGCLGRFSERSFIAFDKLSHEVRGYIIATPLSLGPFVAQNFRVSVELLAAVSKLDYRSPPTVIFPEANVSALDFYSKIGSYKRHCTHMFLNSTEGSVERSFVFGQFSFATG